MDEFGPARVEQPQGAGALPAEMPLRRAGLQPADAVRARLLDLGPVDRQRLAPCDLERAREPAQVDGVAAASGGLAADRAIAELVGLRRVRVHGEAHRTAAAGTRE